jgi:hypothetical protein
MVKTLVIMNDAFDIFKIGRTLSLMAHDMFFMFCAEICSPHAKLEQTTIRRAQVRARVECRLIGAPPPSFYRVVCIIITIRSRFDYLSRSIYEFLTIFDQLVEIISVFCGNRSFLSKRFVAHIRNSNFSNFN